MGDREEAITKKDSTGYSMVSKARKERGVDKVIKNSHENDPELDRNANGNDPHTRR